MYALPVIELCGIATHIEATCKQPFGQPKLIAALVKPGCLDHQSSSEQQQQQSVSQSDIGTPSPCCTCVITGINSSLLVDLASYLAILSHEQ